jgi:hypothetical protein
MPETLDGLADAIRGRVVEGVRIHDAQAFTDVDTDGEPVVRLRVLVGNPRAGERTWPVETHRAINRLARQEAARLGVTDWVYVSRVALREAARGGFPAATRSA